MLKTFSQAGLTLTALAALGLLAAAPRSASAQTTIVASDEASNYTSSGQITTLNGGSGFASAFSATGTGGYFLGDAKSNGGGTSPGLINSSNGSSFGLYANPNSANVPGPFSETLTRAFSAPLTTGGTFSLGFDNGFESVGAFQQIFLGTTSNPNLIQFGFVGGTQDYQINGVATSLGFTDGGLNVKVTLDTPTTYTLSATRLGDNATATGTGTLPAGTQLNTFSVNSTDSSTGSSFNLFVNKTQVTALSASAAPEPSQIAMLGFAALGVLGVVLRAKKRTVTATA